MTAQEWPDEATLQRSHREELIASAISPEIAAARRYRTIPRPSPNDDRSRPQLKRAKIPTWAHKEDRLFPMLAIPRYSPAGTFDGLTVKPRTPVKMPDGRTAKYAHPKHQPNSLDVHPVNKDRIVDPTIPLFVVEGVKKADAVTSTGRCAVAVNGVYGWRRTGGAEAVWESIPLKGRQVVLVFDSDTNERLDLQRAVARLGRWLKTKGATVHYVLIPADPTTPLKVGIDDYLAAGGRFEALAQVSSLTPPLADENGQFTDAKLTDYFAERVLADEFVSAGGLGWFRWDGARWKECDEDKVLEALRVAARDEFDKMLDAAKGNPSKLGAADLFKKVLSAGRLSAILKLLAGHSLLRVEPDDLDSHPDLLNTPEGVVDLRTGTVTPHNPKLLLTKVSKGSYRPGYTHPDWTAALTALPPAIAGYVQLRMGQAITGHAPESDDCLVLVGNGSNGKSLLTSDGVMRALGDHAMLASPGLILGKTSSGGPSPERASIRGARFVLIEELPEGRSLSIEELKRIIGTSRIRARFLHKNEIEFDASHTLFVTTNYLPSVNETDDGAWRRLCPVDFPYKFVTGTPNGRDERQGDGNLKTRVRGGSAGQHDAIVTWLVEGATQYLTSPDLIMLQNRPMEIQIGWSTWRGEADRVWSFLRDRIEADPNGTVAKVDLYHAFTKWLEEGGYAQWSQETFFKRLLKHEVWRSYGTTETRTHALADLSRPTPDGSTFTSTLPPLSGRQNAFRGVRFTNE